MALDKPVTTKKRRAKEDLQAFFDEDVHTKFSNESTEKKKRKHVPKFWLKGTTGNVASLVTQQNERIPLMLTDIQHLLVHSLLGNLNLTQSPRWYALEKCSHISQTTCIVFENISIKQWETYKTELNSITKIFDNFVEILTPSAYDGSLVDELALVPLSEAEKDELIQKYGSMNLALEARKDLNVMMKAVFPIRNDEDANVSFADMTDKYPRTQLILSAWQLVEENYPLPLKGKLEKAYVDYVLTKEEYHPVTANSPMFALDCEMCITKAGSELTRVSIVNEKHESVYETLVKPYNSITDYLTRFSGITKDMLEPITKRIEDVQNDLRQLLPPDVILVGQSLNSDLHALKMMHPYIIDTSLVYNFTGERTRKPKLKTLAKEYLQEDIQSSKKGHCSIEDALACMKLVQLKLSRTIEFGDAVHINRAKYKENVVKMTETPQYALSIFNHILEKKKTSIVIGCDDITGDYHTYLMKAKDSVISSLKKNKAKKIKLTTVDSTEDIITSLCEAVSEFNFSMAHMKLDEISKTQLLQIDKWVESIWGRLKSHSLFVVIFGGDINSNGLGMMAIKP